MEFTTSKGNKIFYKESLSYPEYRAITKEMIGIDWNALVESEKAKSEKNVDVSAALKAADASFSLGEILVKFYVTSAIVDEKTVDLKEITNLLTTEEMVELTGMLLPVHQKPVDLKKN